MLRELIKRGVGKFFSDHIKFEYILEYILYSFNSDANELLPSLWEGIYACPDGNSHTIQVNVTQRKVSSILMSAVLTFEGISTTASGTFGHRTLNIQSNENKTVILYAEQPQNSLTTMDGDFEIDGNKCPVTLNMQKCEYTLFKKYQLVVYFICLIFFFDIYLSTSQYN